MHVIFAGGRIQSVGHNRIRVDTHDRRYVTVIEPDGRVRLFPTPAIFDCFERSYIIVHQDVDDTCSPHSFIYSSGNFEVASDKDHDEAARKIAISSVLFDEELYETEIGYLVLREADRVIKHQLYSLWSAQPVDHVKQLPSGKFLQRTQPSQNGRILHVQVPLKGIYPGGNRLGENLCYVSIGASFLVTINDAGTNKDLMFVVV